MRTILCLLIVIAGGCSPSVTGPGNSGNRNDAGVLIDGDGGGGGGGGDGGGGGGGGDFGINRDAFFYQDPPAMYCAIDGGTIPQPPTPGGTAECPDDKNREGCPCPAEGMTAACWPGARKDRNIGICQDGMTTCRLFGEIQLAWGACEGYVLPIPGATGRDACECFSQGTWKIDNLSPCILSVPDMGVGSAGAVSTNTMGQCPAPPFTPSPPWSPNTVTVDCQGRFKLCYAIKAGDAANPQTSDCTVKQVCTEADYVTINTAQPFPPLPEWTARTSVDLPCTTKFGTNGGYGEMSVTGTTITCGMLNKVFNRVKYCPIRCTTNPPPNPTPPECMNCMQGGGGGF